MMGKDKNKDREHQDGETAASSKTITSPWDARQSNRDLNQDWEARDTARDATLAKTIAEAVTREMAKAHMQYQALLNDRSTAAIPTSLKVTSGANGFKVMDPFDWTKDKVIYQRWQLWSEKARFTLDSMEGDSEKTKISYFHHWINGEGMGHIESWKNKWHSNTMQNDLRMFHTDPHNTTNASDKAQNMAQLATSFRTTTPSTATTGTKTTTKQVNPVHVHPDTSCKELLGHCIHVHQPAVQVCN